MMSSCFNMYFGSLPITCTVVGSIAHVVLGSCPACCIRV
ncbi:hypothetical protein BVRB_1g009490 [Beta vulgaris subsp. vulgaris]|nr:hypothetical protein BVRB_1g009490 [Beta vulgaris subsp. vulgaris]